MKMNRLFFASLLSVFFLMGCSDDDTFDAISEDNPTLLYDTGFFVVNEGNSAGGSVTYISDNLETVEQQVYRTANPTEDLGLGMFLQSIFFHGDKAYIVSNSSNLITVVNRYTFELMDKITEGLKLPRYGTVENGKAYVTNMGSFEGGESYVAVINLETLEVEKTISVEGSAEYIQEENGQLYVQNAAFGTGNTISVIDPTSNTITQTIAVAEGLNSFEIEDQTLYALSTSEIQKVNLATQEKTTLLTFPTDYGNVANLEVEDDNLYYTVENKVFSVPTHATKPSNVPLIEYSTASAWGMMYGFAIEDDKIYIADGGDFASDSNVFVYTIDGSLIKEIPVGIAPNGFYFND